MNEHIDAQLSDFTVEKLKSYLSELMEWNRRFNLTSFPEDRLWEEVVEGSLLFVDCLKHMKGRFPDGFSLCDIGTGAGIPGLVIKIVLPEVEVSLIESKGKKTKFLQAVADKLDLKGLNIINMDVREFAVKGTNVYNIVTGRAFGKNFLKHASKLVSPEGSIMYYRKNYQVGEFRREPVSINRYAAGSVLIW